MDFDERPLFPDVAGWTGATLFRERRNEALLAIRTGSVLRRLLNALHLYAPIVRPTHRPASSERLQILTVASTAPRRTSPRGLTAASW